MWLDVQGSLRKSWKCSRLLLALMKLLEMDLNKTILLLIAADQNAQYHYLANYSLHHYTVSDR